MFELIAGIALITAALVVWGLHRQAQAAEQRAAAAETEAAMSWGKGFQAGASEQYARLERDVKASYDKGFESGWNTCVTQFEDRSECKEVAAA